MDAATGSSGRCESARIVCLQRGKFLCVQIYSRELLNGASFVDLSSTGGGCPLPRVATRTRRCALSGAYLVGAGRVTPAALGGGWPISKGGTPPIPPSYWGSTGNRWQPLAATGGRSLLSQYGQRSA